MATVGNDVVLSVQHMVPHVAVHQGAYDAYEPMPGSQLPDALAVGSLLARVASFTKGEASPHFAACGQLCRVS